MDLSYNNLAGEIPDSRALQCQKPALFDGNFGLCGKPLHIPCRPSAPISPPAIAAFPRSPDAFNGSEERRKGTNRMKTGTIIGIVVGDVAGITLLALGFLYISRKRKRALAAPNNSPNSKKSQKQGQNEAIHRDWLETMAESRRITACPCFQSLQGEEEEEEVDEESSSTSSGSETNGKEQSERESQQSQRQGGTLVTVDGGEMELELESLLRASAYILGATGSSIMYRAVLEDGSALAVRRIGDSGVEKAKDFESHVRAVAKLVHPNLVRVRGFYWGTEDKLVIYDYVSNGSLANARYRKMGSSPCHLPWEARLRIAKGVARGLAYLHDKKLVHGNLKPSNILLDADMEPKIADFGLEKLVSGDSNACKLGGSMRNFGSKRSTSSRDSFRHDQVSSVPGLSPSPNPSPSPSSIGCMSPYHPPESLRSLKPTARWDVYSYGVVLLELLTGKILNLDEVGPATAAAAGEEERSKLLRTADVAIRADMEGKEDALLACFRLGFSCASQVPHKRPSMKEALQVLEKIPSSSSSSLHSYWH